jgi:hypothetical protein
MNAAESLENEDEGSKYRVLIEFQFVSLAGWIVAVHERRMRGSRWEPEN